MEIPEISHEMGLDEEEEIPRRKANKPLEAPFNYVTDASGNVIPIREKKDIRKIKYIRPFKFDKLVFITE